MLILSRDTKMPISQVFNLLVVNISLPRPKITIYLSHLLQQLLRQSSERNNKNKAILLYIEEK